MLSHTRASYPYKVSLNCCSTITLLKSTELFNQQEIAISIHALHMFDEYIRAPSVQSIWFFGTSYVIPNIDSVVCGGTSQVDNWDTSESIEDTKRIMDDIHDIFPSVIDAPKVWKNCNC